MASGRMTPVQAAKAIGIRPQIVYGFIRSNRLGTYSNPDGKAALVELSDVERLIGGVKHHREKDPKTGLPVRREAQGVSRGTILSTHGEIKGAKRRNAHRVTVVDVVFKGESSTLIYTKRSEDGAIGIVYETERLADAIAKGKCHIESPEALLGVVMFHYAHSDNIELAASLQLWCEANKIAAVDLMEKEGELETITESTTPAATATEDEDEAEA